MKKSLVALVGLLSSCSVHTTYAQVDTPVTSIATIDEEYIISPVPYVESIREFAFKDLRMPSNNYFTRFPEETNNAGVQYRLFVVKKGSPIPDVWTNQKTVDKGDHFYFVDGHLNLYSKTDTFEDEVVYFQDRGYEVKLWKAQVFASESGTLLDESFLAESAIAKCHSVLHESWHFEVRKTHGYPYPDALNESGASFVGYMGCIEFAAQYFGKDSEEYIEAINSAHSHFEWAESVNSQIKEYNARSTKPTYSPMADAGASPAVPEGNVYGITELWQHRPYTKHFPLMYQNSQTNGFYPTLELLRSCEPKEKECIDLFNK